LDLVRDFSFVQEVKEDDSDGEDMREICSS
jgi:CRP-like cAMP-binding protein